MKVGILSMQRVVNYGSFLQAYALKKTIESLGHQCEFIDIEQGKIFPELKRTPIFLLKKFFDRFLKHDFITRILYAKKLQSRFQNEFFVILGINIHTIKHFDTVVIGSDEVFNFAQHSSWGYTSQLYGRVKNADKIISYAASFGHTTWDDVCHYGVGDDIANSLRHLSAISVRDENSSDIIERLIHVISPRHVDPVLMFDFAPYIVHCEEKDYLIVYAYPNRIKDREEIASITSFAKKHNKKIISIGSYFSWADKTVIPNPFEVLGYICHADFIITDTFHGSVMSLKFNRQFATLIRSSNKQKIESLLSQFNLIDRAVSNLEQLETILLKPVQYAKINALLDNEVARSIDYLHTNIKGSYVSDE